MKVYIYSKKNKHKRICEIVNVNKIECDDKFFIITDDVDVYSYEKEKFMISVFCY